MEGFSFPRRGLANYGFSACGSGHPGTVLQPAGLWADGLPGRNRLVTHKQDQVLEVSEVEGRWRPSGLLLTREPRPPGDLPSPAPVRQGAGSWGKRKVPGETAGLTQGGS